MRGEELYTICVRFVYALELSVKTYKILHSPCRHKMGVYSITLALATKRMPELTYFMGCQKWRMCSATHGTINMIANRLMAVSERSSLAGAFKRVLIHDIERWKVGGSNPSVPMVPS